MNGRRLVALAVITLFVAMVLPRAAASHTYRIGFIASVTGPGASLGIPERFVARMLQDRLTGQRGVVGPDRVRHAVEILVFDDQSSASVAAGLARRLIEEERVTVLVAGTLSGPSLAMVPIASEARTPMISMASARAIIEDPTTKQMRPWIFKPVPENLHSAEKQVEYLSAVGVKSVCYLYENTAYGQDTLASANALYPKAGITVAYGDSFDRTGTEFPQVARVRAAGCQAVVIGSIPPAASLINVAVREGARRLRILHGHGACSPDLIATAGVAAEGTVMPCGKILVADQLPFDDPVKTFNLRLISDYRVSTGGQPISTFSGHAYDALSWALAALRYVPDGVPLPAQRQAVRDALETKIVSFVGTHGIFTLRAEDHLGFKAKDFAFVSVRRGTFQILPRSEWK